MNALNYARHAGNLFVLPDSVLRIRELGADETASTDDIAQVINYDPALAGQLLKIANSAMYAFENKIATTSKAIQVIGTDAVYDLALAYSVSNTFKEVEKNVIDLDLYWQLSVCTALIAKQLAELRNEKESERLFVTGLLHNIGELVMVQLEPSMATRCAAISTTHTPLDQQQQHLGFPYSDISAALLEQWQVPDDIVTPIRHQHAQLTEPKTSDEYIVQLSRAVALGNVYRDFFPQFVHGDEEYLQQLDLTKRDLDYVVEQTNLQCMGVMALFNPKSFTIY